MTSRSVCGNTTRLSIFVLDKSSYTNLNQGEREKSLKIHVTGLTSPTRMLQYNQKVKKYNSAESGYRGTALGDDGAAQGWGGGGGESVCA